MKKKLKTELIKNGTDLDGALYRFADNEELYEECLQVFLKDTTINDLGDAIAQNNWDDAFTAAHAIKGVAGNMGFIPLFHVCAETVIHIRSGRMREIGPSYSELKNQYLKITEVIKNNLQNGRKKNG